MAPRAPGLGSRNVRTECQNRVSDCAIDHLVDALRLPGKQCSLNGAAIGISLSECTRRLEIIVDNSQHTLTHAYWRLFVGSFGSVSFQFLFSFLLFYSLSASARLPTVVAVRLLISRRHVDCPRFRVSPESGSKGTLLESACF